MRTGIKNLRPGLPKYLFSNSFESESSRTGQSSVDINEVETFSKIKDWWDPNGSQRALHAFNYSRVNYVKKIYNIHSNKKPDNKFEIFKGLDIIDVGCGAGLFCEVSFLQLLR